MTGFEVGTVEGGDTKICDKCGSTTAIFKETAPNKKIGITYVVFGWIFSVISIVFMPLLFGSVAFCIGVMTYFDRSKVHGALLMFFAATGLVIGSLISIFVAGTMFI